jgi:undecaprenyl-diphosphatase
MENGLPAPVARQMGPAGRFGTRITLFALALALVGVPFGLLLEQVVRNGPLVRIDTWAANHLHEIVRDSPLAVDALEVVSFLGKPIWFFIICVPVGAFLLYRRRVRLTIFLATTAIVGGLIDTAVKMAVDRDRPSLEDPVATAFGQSFPSGHSMASVVCYGALLLIFMPVIPATRRHLAIAATALLVLAIGFTRLALGVHFISDVLGGFVLGAAWLAASTAAFEIWREDRGRRRTQPLDEGVEPEAEPDLHVTHA